uniref:Fe2OG dioxygenase domain-containing protein n=1 Tax=viral metagenome TaxID=1070528 RepID=A0A6C0AC61_9ZZZZ
MDSFIVKVKDKVKNQNNNKNINNKIRVLETKNSFLDIYDLSQDENFKNLVKSSVKETTPLLNIKPEIVVYGKKRNQNRDIGFFSNTSIGYKYSGQLAKSIKLTKSTKLLLEYINYKFNANFNGILINKYNDGKESIGKHSDDESCLGNVGVMAISFGAVRKFRIKDKFTGSKQLDLDTKNYSIIHMGGNFQKEFTHEIPIESKVKTARWSLTFRHHTE